MPRTLRLALAAGALLAALAPSLTADATVNLNPGGDKQGTATTGPCTIPYTLHEAVPQQGVTDLAEEVSLSGHLTVSCGVDPTAGGANYVSASIQVAGGIGAQSCSSDALWNWGYDYWQPMSISAGCTIKNPQPGSYSLDAIVVIYPWFNSGALDSPECTRDPGGGAWSVPGHEICTLHLATVVFGAPDRAWIDNQPLP